MPRVESTLAPRSVRDDARGPAGRRLICSSPVRTAMPRRRSAADPITVRMVTPELRTSITSSGGTTSPPVPVTIQASGVRLTCAPSAR